MNERFPTEQNPESDAEKQKIDREQVVSILKERGFEDPEARALFNAWSDQREAEVNVESTPDASLMYAIEVADVYSDAGFTDAAYDAYEDAIEFAYQFGQDDIVTLLELRLDALE